MAGTYMALEASQTALLSNRETYSGMPYQYWPEMLVAIFTGMGSDSDGMVPTLTFASGS